MTDKRYAATVLLAALPLPGAAQQIDEAAAARWQKVEIVHFEAEGVVAQKHVQIPPGDYDLYADITDRIHLSFDWNRETKTLVGKPVFTNFPSTVSNVVGMGAPCPTGELKGSYDHFEVLDVRQPAPEEAIELVGQRVHPDTLVAEACGPGVFRKGATEKTQSEALYPPDPEMFSYASMLPPDNPIKISADGKSLVMQAEPGQFQGTFTPSPK